MGGNCKRQRAERGRGEAQCELGKRIRDAPPRDAREKSAGDEVRRATGNFCFAINFEIKTAQ